MECPEDSCRLSGGAILSCPQCGQADPQRPSELCLTDPECASKTDQRIVGAIEVPETSPRKLIPHNLTLIEFFPLSTGFQLLKVMTILPIQGVKIDDSRLKVDSSRRDITRGPNMCADGVPARPGHSGPGRR
jgi:hypothetical protein